MRQSNTEPRRSTPELAPALDMKAIRRVLSRFATGITVVTVGGAEPHGMTANAFTSVSLDPPLVLVCVQHSARMHEVLRESRSFAVSMLGAHQEREARIFANHHRPRTDEFSSLEVTPGPYSGAPLFRDALAWLECELRTVYEGGDHSIFIGRVQMIGLGTAQDALLFYEGVFHRLAAEVALPDTA